MKPIIDISVLIKALTHPWNVWILLGVRRVRVRMAVQRREFILCEKSPLEKSRREKLRTAKWVSKKSKQSLPDLKNKSLLLTESSEVFRAEAGVVNCPTKYLCSSYISRCEVPGFFFRNDSRFQLPHGSRQWKKLKKTQPAFRLRSIFRLRVSVETSLEVSVVSYERVAGFPCGRVDAFHGSHHKPTSFYTSWLFFCVAVYLAGIFSHVTYEGLFDH